MYLQSEQLSTDSQALIFFVKTTIFSIPSQKKINVVMLLPPILNLGYYYQKVKEKCLAI